MSARLLSFVIWAAVAASIAMWASRLVVRSAPVPPHAEVAGPAAVPTAPLTRLFGLPPAVQAAPDAAPVPAVRTQFKLIGVVAPRAGQRNGLAVIAADDRPPRAVPVGGRVDDSLVVLSINHRQVEIGPKGGPAAVSLNLPPVAEAARGVPATTGGRPSPMVPGMPAGGAPIGMPQQVMPVLPPNPQLQQEFPAATPGEATRPIVTLPGMPAPGGGVLQR